MPPAPRQAQLAKRREAYRKRSLGRKASLVALRGGCCERCGYDTSVRALHFHHRDPADKTQVNNQRSSRFNATWLGEREWPPPQEFWDEFDSCELICANCHMETEEQERHGSNEWKSHIDPSIYSGLQARQRGVEDSPKGSQTVTNRATKEITHG